MAINELYKTLKDHKNPFMQELVTASYQYSFREGYQSLRGMSPLSSQELEDRGRENVQPLMIDYDLIEVNIGICWSIKKRALN